MGRSETNYDNLYQMLFENMLNASAYCRMVFEDDKPQDFIYLNVNKAFDELRQQIEKRILEQEVTLTELKNMFAYHVDSSEQTIMEE